jgi:hypothetical protein
MFETTQDTRPKNAGETLSVLTKIRRGIFWAHPAHAPDRAFRSNLLASPKGFPLQSLARFGFVTGRGIFLHLETPDAARHVCSTFFQSPLVFLFLWDIFMNEA